MKCQNLFITSKVSERSKVKGQIQRSKYFENIQFLKKKSKSPILEISQTSNPLKISPTCCKVKMFFKPEKFLKDQNISKNLQVS